MTTANNTKNAFDFSKMNVQSTESLKNYRKENGYFKSLSLVALHGNEIKSFAEIRHYRTAATNYVCFWIHSPVLGLYGQTGGKAGGYGYDRSEAALSEAAKKHGINVPSWCDERQLLEGLAKHLGLQVYSVIETNA